MKKLKQLKFNVDPYQGAAALVNLQIESMKLVEMKRAGNQAICTYEPLEESQVTSTSEENLDA